MFYHRLQRSDPNINVSRSLLTNSLRFVDYTILTSNYTERLLLEATVAGLLFRNYCLSDYGSELASFHSQGDADSYFDIIENSDRGYSEHPYGLRFMDCTIGLTNRSFGNTWEWYDGTPYDWGVKGSATDQWDSDPNYKDLRCVLINNALNRKTGVHFNVHQNMLSIVVFVIHHESDHTC